MSKLTTNISIRMDRELKKEAESLFLELGMNLTAAFNIFVRQALREGRIAFDISVANSRPNLETVVAMLEAEKIAKDSGVKAYDNLDELLDELKNG